MSIGVSVISAVLKKAGHKVIFFDTSRFKEDIEESRVNYSERSIQKMKQTLQFLPVDLPPIKKSGDHVMSALHYKIKLFKPDLIGFSATSSEFPYLTRIVREIKRYRIPIIVGGAHATVSPLEVLEVDGIDMAVLGEGEEAILELTEAIESGSFRTDIKNIYYKKDGLIIQNAIRPYIKDLNSLPFMDLEIFDKYHHLGAYQGQLVTYARVETGRGCPYNCTYCVNRVLHENIYNHERKHVRNKLPRRVIEELEFTYDKINFDIVRFVDETFTSYSIEWLKEFVSLYKSKINKPMIITTRPELVIQEKMELLRTAHGNIQISMGIESGSERIRKEVLNRKISDKTIIEAYRLCHELGFSTAAFNMIGLPGEVRRDFFKTIRLNIEAKVQTPMLSYFYPFPGCKLRDVCIKEGYVNDELHEVDYSVSSVLKFPNFPIKEIEGLKRTFVMYVKMDRSFYPDIRKAEQDDVVFSKLVDLYNDKILSAKNLKSKEEKYAGDSCNTR